MSMLERYAYLQLEEFKPGVASEDGAPPNWGFFVCDSPYSADLKSLALPFGRTGYQKSHPDSFLW
jgi:hypothetical protein